MTALTSPPSAVLLYLDFDGVLHPADVWFIATVGPQFGPQTQGHTLFEHAGLLEELLAPYPGVRVVLSTSWVRVYGLAQATSQLPTSLQARVVGATFDPDTHGPGFGNIARGYQVLQDVQVRRPRAWLALDDDARDWPQEHAARLLPTDPLLGLACADTQAALKQWLAGLT